MMLDITQQEFDQIREIMYRRTGVALKETKKPLVLTRLRKRLEELGMTAFTSYIPQLDKSGSEELEIFINALTTNETYFFRHTKQFNYLFEKVLPAVLEMKRAQREIRVWSAASSTGEEPYSLALTLKEFFKGRPGWKVTLVASDINTEVIEGAQQGIFSERSIKDVPVSLKQKYFSEAPDNDKKMWKQFQLSKEIIHGVRFTQHNLLQLFPQRDFDIIFIRNVMIYFDNESKQKVVDNAIASLAPGGYFFISLSESLNDVRNSLKSVYSGVYQR